MDRKWMIWMLLILGAMIASGCAVSKETMRSYNEAKDLFQKATLAGAKKCAPCQYATAEAYLALANHEATHFWRELERLDTHIKIVREQSLEALKLTPCDKPPVPPAPPKPPVPTPAPPLPRCRHLCHPRLDHLHRYHPNHHQYQRLHLHLHHPKRL